MQPIFIDIDQDEFQKIGFYNSPWCFLLFLTNTLRDRRFSALNAMTRLSLGNLDASSQAFHHSISSGFRDSHSSLTAK
jgi:hypothetical protein